MADDITEAKRASEVALRPGKTAPVPVPAGLQHEYSDVSYKAAAPKAEKQKSDEDKSLEWNAQQRKVAESQ
jgi:hypothetical protein